MATTHKKWDDVKVIVQRRESGKLWRVLLVTDNVIVNLPVKGINYTQTAGDLGDVALIVGGHRISFETISEEECGYGV